MTTADRDRLDVATGDGLLALEQLQLPGGKALATKDFLNAARLAPGTRLQTPDDAGA